MNDLSQKLIAGVILVVLYSFIGYTAGTNTLLAIIGATLYVNTLTDL